ncbi:hypothetical protein ACN47E_004908 [Coniothyrium glycines]
MVVRDPNFWRRFSIAVHQDDLAKEELTKRPEMKHSASWLESQRRKKRQRSCMCWLFWGTVMLLVAGAVAAVVVLRKKGVL